MTTLHRIYQGRVTKVERDARAAGEKQPSWTGLGRVDGEALASDHFALFQDAVNYYLAALLALAQTPANPLWEIRQRLASENKLDDYQVWNEFRRRGARRAGMRESLARTLGLEPNGAEAKNLTPEAAFALILHGNQAGPEEWDAAVRLLLAQLEKGKGEGIVRDVGATMLPAFCDPGWKGQSPASEAGRLKAHGEKHLYEILHAPDSLDHLELVRSRLKLEYFANPARPARQISGKLAKNRLLAAIGYLRENVADLPSEEVQKWENIVAAFSDTTKPAEEKASAADLASPPGEPEAPRYVELRAHVGSSVKGTKKVPFCCYLLFTHVEASPALFQILCNTCPKTKPTKVQKANEDDSAEFAGDPVEAARGPRGFVLPSFTSLPFWRQTPGVGIAWRSFDILAFREALKSIHQINLKTKERREKADAVKAQLAVMEGKAARAKKAAVADGDEEAAPVPVLAGDPRISRLEELLTSELAAEYMMAEGEVKHYSIHERTLGGYKDLRRDWNKLAEKEKLTGAGVLGVLRQYQKDHPELVGSVRLFEELAKEENWIIWRKPDEKTAAMWDKAGHAEDALAALLLREEARRDLVRLEQPVRFTPADPVASRRQYEFPGLKRKDLGHVAGAMAMCVELAIRSPHGWAAEVVRFEYSAPRLQRDGLRVAEPGEKLDGAAWLQPMARALGVEVPETQDFSTCPVFLMPEERSAREEGGKTERRILLNLPISLESTLLAEQVTRGVSWSGQFATLKEASLYLFWPGQMPDKRKAEAWWTRLDSFQTLGVDLGQRDAGAFAVMEARAGTKPKTHSRWIGNAGGKDWHAHAIAMRLLRLPGEDALVWERGKFKQEPYGEKGRSASEKETTDAVSLVREMGFEAGTIFSRPAGDLSFPEQNDRLVFALRRKQSQLARWQGLSWRLTDEKYATNARKEIEGMEDLPPELKGPVEGGRWEEVRLWAAGMASALREQLPEWLEDAANRCLPLRGRRWKWQPRQDEDSNFILAQTARGTDDEPKKLHGQRGLSLKRLEQLEELRRRCQSLNRALQNKPGERPAQGQGTGGRELPDPCPDILEKMERLREQRVNQTAHVIVAAALGLRLKPGSERTTTPEQRAAGDVHGEYEPIPGRRPVDFIAMEDLGRYLSSQGRARSENSRLMKWCHRQILAKVKMLAEPFGIPVVEVNAAYSSRFCGKTGCPGFRAVAVTPDDKSDYRWKRLLEKLAVAEAEGKSTVGEDFREGRMARQLFTRLETLNKGRTKGKPPVTLLAPQAGGPVFVPMVGAASQADINAAVNIALRGMAAPDAHEIHVRIRTEKEKGQYITRLGSAREKARWGSKRVISLLDEKDAKSLGEDRSPNFFPDSMDVAEFDKARIEGIPLPVASGRGIWGTVRKKEWERCVALNSTPKVDTESLD